jgi:hypothetical protein
VSRATVLHHADCPDGFTAAWVATRALNEQGFNVDVCAVSHGKPPPHLGSTEVVYIVDFSYPHATLVEMANDRRVVVLDHHQSAVDDICAHHGDYPGEAPWGDGSKGVRYVARYSHWYETLLDTNRSGAGITWDYFHPGEPRPPIVDYVEDRDLWRFRLPHSKAVSAYIRSQPYTFDAWDELADMEVDHMADLGEGVLLHIDAYCRAAANHAYWCEMGGRRFPIVNVTYESCSEVAAYLLDRYSTDMVGYFFERGDGRWQYGFRSRGDVVVHDFAAGFGGGGHPNASGCTVAELIHTRGVTP